jgi:hypothetical protein
LHFGHRFASLLLILNDLRDYLVLCLDRLHLRAQVAPHLIHLTRYACLDLLTLALYHLLLLIDFLSQSLNGLNVLGDLVVQVRILTLQVGQAVLYLGYDLGLQGVVLGK